jgi:hypothetical protein
MTFRLALLCIACCTVVACYAIATPAYEEEHIAVTSIAVTPITETSVSAITVTGEPVVERRATVAPSDRVSVDDEMCGQSVDVQRVTFKPLELRVKRHHRRK